LRLALRWKIKDFTLNKEKVEKSGAIFARRLLKGYLYILCEEGEILLRADEKILLKMKKSSKSKGRSERLWKRNEFPS
jgi:hypothetical protein